MYVYKVWSMELDRRSRGQIGTWELGNFKPTSSGYDGPRPYEKGLVVICKICS